MARRIPHFVVPAILALGICGPRAATALVPCIPCFYLTEYFEFQANVDATAFGLSASEPILVLFSYQPFVAPVVVSYGTPAFRTVYGPIDGAFEIGGQVVDLQAQVDVDDNNNGYDEFEFFAANYVVGTSVVGSVNGTGINSFSLAFLDASQAMFGSTALPASADFGQAAQHVFVEFEDYLNQKQVRTDFYLPADAGSFAFTNPAPEPASAPLALAALGALGLLASRRPARDALTAA
jgi:hypothetical protein